MSAPNFITVAGNLTADPEMRLTSSEVHFARLRIAVSRRIYVTDSNQWEDRQDGFFSVTCWRDMARHTHASLKKGDRVVVSGRLIRRQFEAKTEDGTETRHVVEIDAEEIGASLRWGPWARQQTRPLTAEPDLNASAAGNPAGGDESTDEDTEDVAAAA